MSGNLLKLAFFEWGGSLTVNIWQEMWRRPATNVGVRRLEWLPFRVVSKYPQCVI